MKNKFLADSRYIPLFILFFFMGLIVLVLFIVFDGFHQKLYLVVILSVIFLALPFLFAITTLIAGCVMIELSEEGIANELFGKRLKFFKWDEISEVKTKIPDKNGYRQILFYRNKNKNARKIKSKKISFAYYCSDLSIMALLQRYAPEHIIEKLNNNDRAKP